MFKEHNIQRLNTFEKVLEIWGYFKVIDTKYSKHWLYTVAQKVGLLSGALKTVSAISGPTIFCSVLKNFQAVSWAGCRNRSIKVTTPSKQICIKNKVNLSSVNWKFKRRSGTSFNLSQWIKFKICLLQLKLLLKQIKTVQKLFHILP